MPRLADISSVDSKGPRRTVARNIDNTCHTASGRSNGVVSFPSSCTPPKTSQLPHVGQDGCRLNSGRGNVYKRSGRLTKIRDRFPTPSTRI